MSLSREDISKEIEKRHWFHQIEVLPGLWTPGHYKPNTNWVFDQLELSKNLEGKRALDLGCADGAHSLSMAKWGAEVTAIDVFTEDFRNVSFLSKIFDVDIRYVQSTIYEFQDEPYDIVLALGVLYHLEHPLLGLQCLNKLCKETLLIESHVEEDSMFRNNDYCKFWPGTGLNDDPSNWWTPTRSCLIKMLNSCGFEVEKEFVNGKNRYMLKCKKVKDIHPAFSPKDVFIRNYGHEPY